MSWLKKSKGPKIDPQWDQRWVDGIEHHPKSEELMEHMQAVDMQEGLPFDLSTGGDGDNGETLMYLMDSYFEKQDAILKKGVTLL